MMLRTLLRIVLVSAARARSQVLCLATCDPASLLCSLLKYGTELSLAFPKQSMILGKG